MVDISDAVVKEERTESQGDGTEGQGIDRVEHASGRPGRMMPRSACDGRKGGKR